MFRKETIEPGSLELLKELQAIPVLKDFHLTGGTSLAMQIGHRKSIDLDLFTQNDFDSSSLLEYLEESYQFRLAYSSTNTLKGSISSINKNEISRQYFLKG